MTTSSHHLLTRLEQSSQSWKEIVSSLPEQEKEALMRLLKPRLSKWTMTTPTLKQTAFLLLPHLEALYGGSVGGAKSEGLLQAGSQYLDVHGYSALLIRRSYAQLAKPGALMARSHEWWAGTAASWDGVNRIWRFPDNSSLQFGYLERERDHLQFQSAEYQFIGFDELTQFNEEQYTYLFSRLRRIETLDVPIRMRAASNPGGPGHEWVRERFNLPEGPKHPNRAFVPATLEDNPYLDTEEYEASLAELSESTRRQLRMGDWSSVASGGIFFPDKIEIVELSDLNPSDFTSIVRFWDLAATEKSEDNRNPDWTASVKLGKTKFGKRDYAESDWYVFDVARSRLEPSGVEEFVRRVANRDGHSIPQWFERERGSAGKLLIQQFAKHVIPNHAVYPMYVTGSPVTKAKVPAARANAGRLYVVRGDWNLAFFDELAVFSEEKGQRGHDDQVVALSGAFEAISRMEGISNFANTSVRQL